MKDRDTAQIDALRSTLGKIEVALGSITDAIVWTDGEGRVQWCSASFDRLMGRPRIGILGKSLAALIPLREHGVNLPPEAHPVTLILREGADRSGYYELVRGDDSLSLELTGHFVHIGSSGPSAIVVIRDVTQARGIEQIRLQSAALEAAANAIVMTDLQGYVTWVNGAFSRLTGYSLDEAYGKKLSILKSGRHDEAFYRGLWETILSGKVWQGEMINCRRDGTLYTEYQMITPVRAGDGAIGHFIAIKQDISDRKAAEEELRQAKTAAEGANRAKSEFLANMSHEIRTPMNSIMGFAALLLDDELSPEQRDAVETIGQSAERLLSLINEILDLSRIESDGMAFEEITFDLKELVTESVTLLRPDIGTRPVELRCDLQGDWWHVVGDPLRLRQVILNLVNNAIKFTDEGEIVLSLRTAQEAGETVSLACAVSDTGIGIAEDQLQAIFEAFSQADGSTTRRYGGTGLGLAISQRLVGLMGGEITVESRRGSGSTFRFELRLGKGIPGGGGGKPRQPEAADAIASVPAKQGLAILLAEDDPANQKVATAMLHRMGHRVSPAGTGAEAVDMAEDHDYDLILMDVQMPEMDGMEATRRLRRAGITVPIVAMTASAMKGDRERFLAAGMDDYIAKPISRDVLRRVLARYGESGETGRAAPSGVTDTMQDIAEELGIDVSDYRDILIDFIGDKRQDREDLRAAIDSGDVAAVQLLAHKIKGSALNLRLDAVAGPAARIEEAAREGDLSPAHGEMERLSRAFDALERQWEGVPASHEDNGDPSA